MKITHNKVGQNVNLTDSARTNSAANSGKANPAGAGKAGDLKDLGSLKGDVESKADAGVASARAVNSSEGSSRVNLSERAMDIKKAKEIALAAPDVREDKVQRIQKLIDDGKYKVDAKDIADKMVDEEAQWT